MGRPNHETKKKKRRQRKIKQKKLRHTRDMQYSLELVQDHKSSPTCSEAQSFVPTSSAPYATEEAHSNYTDHEDSDQTVNVELESSMNCSSTKEIGDQDIDLLEMKMYDLYRQVDGAPYSPNYLIKCRRNLISKLESCKKELQKVQKQNTRSRLQHKEEIKRI